MTTSTLVPVAAAPEGHRYRRVTVEQVAGPGGAVIGGVDVSRDLDDDVIAEVRRAVLDHHVVFFRGQSLTPQEQVAFSRRFGPFSPVPFIEPVTDHPEVIAVIREASEAQRYTFGSLWHSDFSFLPEPPFASILHALEVPPYGGDTIWANQALAFASLSTGMQAMLSGLQGVHSAVNAYSTKMQRLHDTFTGMTVHTSDAAEGHEHHPVVRVHPETGHPALFVNAQYTVDLVGFARHESKPILDFLFEHAVQPGFTVRWQWEVGDVAMWDNRCLQHMAMADFTGHRRFMHRTTVAGDRPFGT
ncbi:MAG TPA: TauD/TfdA family dioxygenase [Acidimicrobiia bacterium]|nr:TauD/TfdA family dioxygenase [Acidimicrobiia bacterium]